ncbi:Ribonuclease HII [Marinobacterium sp. xm-d-420]|uniref:ribonuclease HII n=1 Tax=unclassified Marinobacterium TaxID=2644139 RepID=UPI001567EBC3|nr:MULTISPECIES: ribonuclease HII [unclassified Marinobacterium]NRP10399.1 Ribonuclease HII [Marinobacterium sp. xm-g-48]NRP28194.1 Ribonuclease HII [Marinobacterium sp. xm-d-420]NRP83498.1 Ribonuclease HII [Marinobacterium sp. xm-d-509]
MQPQEFNFAEHSLFAGVDEVGRGPLVGDVVAAAVILDPNNPIEGLMDSKKLSEKRREALSIEIKERALCWSIAVATPQEIDELNILHATMLAMKRAVLGLSQVPDHVYVDGNRCPEIPYSVEAVVKGDSKVAEISAASIIAKVHRDHQMLELDAQFPQYQFAKHKGYPTPAHLQLIQEHGVLPEYRRSFAPVRRLIEGSQ